MPTIEALRPAGAQIWPLSVKAYHVLGDLGLIPERSELLYGQVFHKMPKSPYHSLLLLRLLELLRRATPSDRHIRPEQPIDCGDSEPEPDLAVLRGTMEDFSANHPASAEFVIEICVSSHAYDRAKLRAYASARVRECWLVLGPEQQIEVYRQPVRDEFTHRSIHGPGGSLTSDAIPGFSVDLASLFRS